MAKDPEAAAKLKEEGNQYYTKGNFHAAEGLYSKAIIADPTNPSLYTNRAMSRIKLLLFESASSDCYACLELSGDNMKAYFVLAQCLLAMQDVDGALENALEAHRIGSETSDKSLAQLTNLVLKCKKERWDRREKQRVRDGQELEEQLIFLLEREKSDNLACCESEIEQAEITEECNRKIGLLRATFEASRSAAEKKREVPDWVIDDISFCVMVDPVITKTGKSYERASIEEALRRNQIDPLTREPLHPSELRANLGLRQACGEFLENNGWAVDW